MPGVDRTKEGEGFHPAHLAQNDPIRPHTQRSDQQVLCDATCFAKIATIQGKLRGLSAMSLLMGGK